MQKQAVRLIGILRRVNGFLALAVGIGLCLCAAFIIAEIILRRFGSGLGGTDEIAGYTMAIATSWGMAYCLLELGHVRIDLLRTRLGGRGRAYLDIFSMAVLAVVAAAIASRCWPVVARSITNNSRANTPLETPLVLVQIPWFMGWVWFALTAFLTLAAALVMVAGREHRMADGVIGIRAEAGENGAGQ